MNEVSEIVEIQISRIKQYSFTINEGIYKQNSTLDVRIDTKHSIDIDKSLMDITLRILFKYPDLEDYCIQSEISNIFFVKDLLKYAVEGEENLAIPSKALVTMMSLSISHARALISSSVGGSLYNGIILPLVNPEEVAKQHFGERVVPQEVVAKMKK